MASVLAFEHSGIGAIRELLAPGVHSALRWADQSVKSASIQANYVNDEIELAVLHRLFTRDEIVDGSYKDNFRGRVERALLANAPPDGRRITVERRSFLARAAKIKKAKPAKRI